VLINCAGLQCDRVARMCGMRPAVRIVPFRGEYYKLTATSEHLVRNLIYPVPDPRFPFLGVHFTRMIHGGIEAGPNAVLALKREGYSRFSLSPRDTLSALTYPGFWHMASRYWRMSLGEIHRSFSTGAFVRALQKLMPRLTMDDVQRHGAGVRAQAVAPDGSLLDDFHILEGERMLHVLNAPSPAATASISIGKTIAAKVS
jgi:L-2-hydroxyglutarate oxidase